MATAKRTTAPTAPAKLPVDIDPDMPEGAQEIDDGDVSEILTLGEGHSITGVYCGSKKTKSGQKDKQSTLHKLRVESGEAVGVWGSYQLDQKLEKIHVGQSVWIKYVGKDVLGNGNTLHKYRVAVVSPLPF